MNQDTDLIEVRLCEWADAVREDDELSSGYASQSPCFIPSWIKDSTEIYELAVIERIQETNACINSLPQEMIKIIMKRFSLAYMAMSFVDEAQSYEIAKKKVAELLSERVRRERGTSTVGGRSLSPREAAAFLGIGIATYWRWVKGKKDFPPISRISARRVFVDSNLLEQWRSSQKKAA